MAENKGYGSGKPRSAVNSRSRQRVAANRFTKGKKNPIDNLVSKAGDVADFIVSGPKETRGKYAELGVSPLKLASVAKALFSAGKISQASALASRIAAKEVGQGAGRGYSSLLTGKLRSASESVFPRNSGARSGEYLGMNSREITANLARKTGRAAGVSMEDIRAISKATANSTTGFTNFSKRVPKVVRGFGTVNPEGYAALQKLPDFLGQGAKQIARKIKKTPKRGGR